MTIKNVRALSTLWSLGKTSNIHIFQNVKLSFEATLKISICDCRISHAVLTADFVCLCVTFKPLISINHLSSALTSKTEQIFCLKCCRVVRYHFDAHVCFTEWTKSNQKTQKIIVTFACSNKNLWGGWPGKIMSIIWWLVRREQAIRQTKRPTGSLLSPSGCSVLFFIRPCRQMFDFLFLICDLREEIFLFYSPSSLLSSTRMISLSRWAGVWLTAEWTERRITDRASFTKMKMREIWGRSLG